MSAFCEMHTDGDQRHRPRFLFTASLTRQHKMTCDAVLGRDWVAVHNNCSCLLVGIQIKSELLLKKQLLFLKINISKENKFYKKVIFSNLFKNLKKPEMHLLSSSS